MCILVRPTPQSGFMPIDPPRGSYRCGFTLIELLAVVAVLGVLVALLLPVVNSAIERGRATECLGNVRAITTAYLAYAADNDGRYPATGTYDWGGGGWGKFWPDLLIEGGYLEIPLADVYLEDRASHPKKGPLWCPSEQNHHEIADYGPSDTVVPHSRTVFPVVRILEPSKTVLISESRRPMGGDNFGGSWWLKSAQWLAQTPTPGSPLPARHSRHVHVGFCDGHVEAFSEKRVIEDRATLFTGPYDSTNPDYAGQD